MRCQCSQSPFIHLPPALPAILPSRLAHHCSHSPSAPPMASPAGAPSPHLCDLPKVSDTVDHLFISKPSFLSSYTQLSFLFIHSFPFWLPFLCPLLSGDESKDLSLTFGLSPRTWPIFGHGFNCLHVNNFHVFFLTSDLFFEHQTHLSKYALGPSTWAAHRHLKLSRHKTELVLLYPLLLMSSVVTHTRTPGITWLSHLPSPPNPSFYYMATKSWGFQLSKPFLPLSHSHCFSCISYVSRELFWRPPAHLPDSFRPMILLATQVTFLKLRSVKSLLYLMSSQWLLLLTGQNKTSFAQPARDSLTWPPYIISNLLPSLPPT